MCLRALSLSENDTVAAMAPFRDGIAKVLEIAGRCRPTLVCAEHEPLECHRCLLIARYLVEHNGAHVVHIQRDGQIEPHEDAEDRLLSKWGGGGDLFRTRAERLSAAYRLQAQKLGVGK